MKNCNIVIALIVYGILFFYMVSCNKSKPMDKIDILFHNAEKLHKGMSKEDVEKILGKPDNIDDQNVWFWVADNNSLKQYEYQKTWNPMMYEMDGFFLLFDKTGKLLSPTLLKNTEASPWETYMDETGNYSREYAEGIFGRNPDWHKAGVGGHPVPAEEKR